MVSGWMKVAAMGLLGLSAAVGCGHSDKPHDYGEARPPVDELSSGDSGLQSKDVMSAADSICRDLLADPNLNASRNAWTIVVDHMEDKTTDPALRPNFDIFLQKLKGDLAMKSNGRIQLITNKSEFYQLRNKELEDTNPDKFGQGGAGNRGAAQAISPDYALTGTAMDMPNRSTNYYLLDFRLDNLHNRTIAFDRQYQVKVAR